MKGDSMNRTWYLIGDPVKRNKLNNEKIPRKIGNENTATPVINMEYL